MPQKKSKEFDCLAFKDQAQAKIVEETRGMSPKEQEEYLRKQVETGPFAEFWKRISARRHSRRVA